MIDGDVNRLELYNEATENQSKDPKGCLWVGVDVGDKETAIVGVVIKWLPDKEEFVIADLIIKKEKNKAKLREMKMDELVSPRNERE